MNRIIKFKAWDEKNKIMHYDVEFIRTGIWGNDWIIFKSDKQKLEDAKVLGNPYFAQQIKLTQFTGLLDKNGLTEVYEGDIIDIIGNIKGNIYESPQIYERGTDLLIERMGTNKWRSTESIAMGRGCMYSE